MGAGILVPTLTPLRCFKANGFTGAWVLVRLIRLKSVKQLSLFLLTSNKNPC